MMLALFQTFADFVDFSLIEGFLHFDIASFINSLLPPLEFLF
jgi:hypothetical protein